MIAAALSQPYNALLTGPTGTGKTWHALQAARASVAAGHRVILVAPFRAILAELGASLADNADPLPVGVFTGETDATPGDDPSVRLLLMTPERLELVTRAWRQHPWLSSVDRLIADEVHLIGEGHRGSRLDGAITRFRRLNPIAQIIAMTGTAGNPAQIADWLDGIVLDLGPRPVPLRWTHLRFKKADQKSALVAEAVQRCVGDGGQSIVFVNSRRRADALAAELQSAGVAAESHHAALSPSRRKDREQRFRDRQLPVLVATATLEAGINLPARQVVIADTSVFDAGDWRPLTVNAVLQRAGRAGRPGLEAEGESVVISPSWDKAPDYARATPEPIRSRLHQPAHLAEWVVAEVDAGLAATDTQLARAFSRTFAAAHLGEAASQVQLKKAVSSMLDAGLLVRRDDDRLRVTRLGRIAARYLVCPDTIGQLAAFPVEVEAPDHRLIETVLATPDCAPLLVRDEHWDKIAAALGADPAALPDQAQVHRLGSTAALLAWISTGDLDRVADAFDLAPTDLRHLADAAARVLLVWSSITAPKRLEDGGREPPTQHHRQLRLLTLRVQHGIAGPLSQLLLVPGIGPAHARRLSQMDIGDLEDLAQADPADIAGEGLSLDRASAWIDAATDLLWLTTDLPSTHITVDLPAKPAAMTRDDALRRRRAAGLRVTPQGESGAYLVEGGSEPHWVRAGQCDCADFAARDGAPCKHLFAVAALECVHE